jgi:hypothetical protein
MICKQLLEPPRISQLRYVQKELFVFKNQIGRPAFVFVRWLEARSEAAFHKP